MAPQQVADLLARRLAEQPAGSSAVESVRRALTSLTPMWGDLRDIVRALRARGSGDVHARVVARVQVAAFDEAVRHWLLDETDRSLAATVQEVGFPV